MIAKKSVKNRLVKAIFGCFFAILGLISPIFASPVVFADNEDNRSPSGELMEPTRIDVNTDDNDNTDDNTETNTETTTENTEEKKEPIETKKCNDSLGSLGWLVCPTTGKISEAVDWLYAKNQELLEINPVEAKDDSPIYQIWTYCLSIANIAFVVFLLIAIYSQITGVGITSYGIKKALPKMIIAAILVNLSFIVCSIGVDISNIIGNSLRDIFTAVEESTVPPMLAESGIYTAEAKFAMSDMYGALADGTAVAGLAGVLAFEGGEIWMLIPVVFGAFIAVVTGLITIALRQVTVTLLIMVAPLAIAAYILPNTEGLFKKWKDLFVKMLVFYPAYSLLFGASSLAGWAIIAGSTNGFTTILGIAVQIFPLFFSWSLMKMSGTFLGTINAKLTGLFAVPLATNRAWADSHRQLTRSKYLSQANPYTPSAKLMQFISNRRIAREEEIKEHEELIRNRGLSYSAMQHYKKDGSPSEDGIETYDRQQRNMRYLQRINWDKNNMNKGLGQLEATRRFSDERTRRRLEELDIKNVEASDALNAELARGEKIDYENAKSRQERMNEAMNAHMDDINGYTVDESGKKITRPDYKFHYAKNSPEYNDAIARYNSMSSIMEGNPQDTHYIMASAAHSYDTHRKIYEGKMQKYFDYTIPTKDLENRLDELSKTVTALRDIDAIVAGMRVLNSRGDTDLVKKQLDQVLSHGVELGTHVSQALASFLMFEVKDSDPFLRRFGKYLNLETARMYNENDRKEAKVTYDEYIRGYHEEPDGQKMYAKKDMKKLVEGTSLDGIERTAFANLDASLMKAYGYKGKGSDWDVEGFLRKKSEIMTAIEPAFLSAGLKWASGSEQINSAVKYWMGYENKQTKNPDGSLALDKNGDPIYDLQAVWEDEAFRGHEKEIEKFFREKTMAFFKDQTLSQFLGMRTDFRDASVKHLTEQFFGDSTKDPEGYKARKKEYEDAMAEINAKQYPGLTEEEAKAKRKQEAKEFLWRNVAGVPLRQILGTTGKLGQMVNTLHSSGGNNMKDWLRIMTNYDNEEAIRAEARQYKKSGTEAGNGADGDGNGPADTFREGCLDELRIIWDERRGKPDDGTFVDTLRAFMTVKFGSASDHIVKMKFEEFYRDNPTATDHELMSVLRDLLENEDL